MASASSTGTDWQQHQTDNSPGQLTTIPHGHHSPANRKPQSDLGPGTKSQPERRPKTDRRSLPSYTGMHVLGPLPGSRQAEASPSQVKSSQRRQARVFYLLFLICVSRVLCPGDQPPWRAAQPASAWLRRGGGGGATELGDNRNSRERPRVQLNLGSHARTQMMGVSRTALECSLHEQGGQLHIGWRVVGGGVVAKRGPQLERSTEGKCRFVCRYGSKSGQVESDFF